LHTALRPMESQDKVLVVDDHEATAKGMRDLLVAAGYKVRIALNGADALQLAADDPPDLVLLDVMMPGMSGVDVCRELKARSLTRLTPVVLVTASHDREYRLSGLEAGADEFLTKPIDLPEFRTRVRSLLRVKRLTDDLESTETIMTMLGQIVEARDPYTEGHCERLAEYATALGSALRLAATDLDVLRHGAMLHDVGKIAVPDGVLLKAGRLDHEEMMLMRQHPVVGDNLCRSVRSLQRVRPIVRSHHERIDGRGYPDGLADGEVPLLAQIVGVVDVFDALTTTRPYREAMTTDAAYEIMRTEAASGWCPPKLVATFIELHYKKQRHAHYHVPARQVIARRSLTGAFRFSQ
jgi:putative two-component system response regulator